MLKKVTRCLQVAVLTTPLFAGGFWLQFPDVSSIPEARTRNLVLLVRPAGCHHPELAKVTASAEGIVNGKRTSLPVKLIALPEPGTYGASRIWPEAGKWVISISAIVEGRETGAVAQVGINGVEKERTQAMAHVPTETEIESSLRRL